MFNKILNISPMKNIFNLFFILSLILIHSCTTEPKKNLQPTQSGQTTAWLPKPEYQPMNSLAIQLNDSAAVLQIRALQDPTIDLRTKKSLLDQSQKMLEECLKIDSLYGLALTNLSAIFLEKKDTGAALNLMKKRLKLEPDMAEGWQAIGIFTDLTGDSTKAREYYQKSIEIFDNRLKMGKKYAVQDDLMYYYDNWSGKAFSLLMLGKTTDAHNSIRALLDEAGVILGENASTYAAMLDKERWLLLKEMKGLK
jgi:tetratricopeptide (TPR) repeat protein